MQCSKSKNTSITEEKTTLKLLLDENPQLWQYLKINPKDASDITEW
jgi:hypothetical protein